MTVMESQALTDLMGRAGASDTQREAWLAERRQGITATEVRDLYTGVVRAQDLIDIKLGRKADSFVPSKYTEWGETREPYLASLAQFAHDIEPESRVFHGPQNSRYLASPDGVGVGRDGVLVAAEYKTSKYPIPVGSEKFDKTGYLIQMTWSMLVLGARRCLYRWEQHNDDWRDVGKQFPEPSGVIATDEHWIEYDEALAADLITLADGFLVELDRQRAEGGPVIDEAVDTHAVNYLRGLAAEKEGKALKEASYVALLAAGVSQESPLARVTFTPAKPGAEVVLEEPDYVAARAAAPEVFEAFQAAQAAWEAVLSEHTVTRTTQGKGTAARVTVTIGKGPKK